MSMTLTGSLNLKVQLFQPTSLLQGSDVELSVHVSHMIHTRTTGVETWITSDGRAYFVQLAKHESSGDEQQQDASSVHIPTY
jgi:N-acetylmuramoyl-L-alanine amidase